MGNPTDYLVGTGESGPRLGVAFNVVPDVHVHDFIFRELCDSHGGDAATALGHYLHEGRVDAELVRDVIADVQGAPIYDGRVVAPMTILDFAAGYGRVARHLKNVVPNAKVVALDVMETAMYFNTAHLGLQAAVSDKDPARVTPFFEFDVVLALAFFSRQPRSRIGPWIDALSGFVKPGGVVVMTAQGAAAQRARLPHLTPDSEGYAFERGAEQGGLAPDEFGNTITLSRYMFRELERVRRVDLVLFRAGAMRNQDDLYVLRKHA